jgi:predicted nucleic acid-binding protein
VIAYIDSSALLRVLLNEPNALRWATITRAISSELLRVECHRTLDRLWHAGTLDDARFNEKRRAAEVFLSRVDLRALTPNLLDVAAAPLPSTLGTLDALHLATALIFRSELGAQGHAITFATHDHALAKVARAMQFETLGT